MTNTINNFKLYVIDKKYTKIDKQYYTLESYTSKDGRINIASEQNNIYRTKYNSCSVFLSAFETNINTPFEVEYTLYAKNGDDELIFLEKIIAEDGAHRFTHLKKNQKYVIRAEDTLGKYISKAVDYISSGPTEDDELDLQIIDFKDNSQLGLIFKAHNLLGDKEINLENHPSFLKVKSLGNDFYQVYVDGSPKQAYEFDIDITDIRPSSTVKFTRHFVINDGYSKPLNVSIEFLDNGSAIIRWSGDGTIDYYKLYFDNQPLKNHKLPEAVGNTGLTTFIINDYPLSETRYLKISSLRHNIEKFSDQIIIDPVDMNFENIDILVEAEANKPIKNTSINGRNPVIYGSPVILTTPGINDSGELYLNGSSGIYFNVEPLNNKDFTIEMYFSLNSLSRDTDRLFEFSNGTAYSMTIAMWANTAKPYLAIKRNNTWTNYGLDKITVELGKYYHYVIMRKNNIFYYFIDGILIESIEDAASLNYTELYIGQTSSGSARIIGKYNTIKLSLNSANYNIEGFISNTITKKTKIIPISNITYDISSNNSLNLYLDHQNNNIDDYSVYLSENENIELTNNFLITKEKSKSIKIENFDVYNNYDKNYKLIVTSNRYNHEYPSEVKDVYIGYNWWTKDVVKPLLWFDASDESTIITNSNNEVTTFLDKSGNNFHAYKPENFKAPIYNSTTKCISTFGNTNERFALSGKFINTTETSDYTIFIVAKGYKNTTNTIGQESGGANFYTYSNLVSTIFQIASTKSDNSSGNYIIPVISLTTNRLTMTETKNSLAPFNISFPHNYTDKILITIKRNSGNIFYSLMGNTYSTGLGTLTYKVDFEKFHLFDTYNQGLSNHDLHELIMVKSFVDDETCNKIQADLSLKWGLNNYLPENHISKKYKDYNNGFIDHTPIDLKVNFKHD